MFTGGWKTVPLAVAKRAVVHHNAKQRTYAIPTQAKIFSADSIHIKGKYNLISPKLLPRQ